MDFEINKIIVLFAIIVIIFFIPPFRKVIFRYGCGCFLWSGCLMFILIILGSIFFPVFLKIAVFIMNLLLKIIVSHYQREAIIDAFREYFGI